MNQHLHSPTKLTEFARDFDNEPDSLIGRFVNKMQNVYNQGYNTVNEVPTTTQSQQQQQSSKSVFYAAESSNSTLSLYSSSKQHPQQQHATSSKASQGSKNEPNSSNTTISSSTNTITEESIDESSERADNSSSPIEINEGRTMVNVLKRISNLVAYRNNDLRNYKDTDLQRFWMPDSKAKECYDCAQKFSTFRRKHHCRLCGQIFCSKCCNQVVPGKIIMCSGDLKVCNYCSKIVLSYLKSPNIAVDLHSDLQALQQNLTNKLEENESDRHVKAKAPMRTQVTRKISVGYQEERFVSHQEDSLSLDDRKTILQQSNSLITLHEEMKRSMASQNCGLDLIEFLNNNHKSSNKEQAIAILSAMLAAGFLQKIVPDSDEMDFDENLHYKFVDVMRQQKTFDHINFPHAYDGTLSPQFDAATGEPQLPITTTILHGQPTSLDSSIENSMFLTATTSKLLESYCDHEEQLLIQILRTYNLDARWAKVLTPLCCRAANHFKPEYCTNDLMDIRNYVNFKKIPGGKRQECAVVGGVAFSKNVAHKEMATRVERPRVLLLQCPVVYERIEGKFVSIDTVLLQEKQYLENVCARIMSFKPNVVLVHKNVAGIAQDILRSYGITLVLDVKSSVMERLARILQCDIVTSIESNFAAPKLGVCDAFYIRTYDDGAGINKTLMFFEKLTNPRGFTCLLRGGTNSELIKVKKAASFLVYARYTWRLEMSFLLDEFAEPMSPKPPIFDSKENSPDDDVTPHMRNINNNDNNNINNKENEDDDPQLRQRRVMERKAEDKIQNVIAENVTDFTDPLRSTNSRVASEATNENAVAELAVEMRYDNRFRNALSSTLLSVSPFVTFPLPYLETESGRKCPLRSFFPTELYFSKLWSSTNPNGNNSTNNNNDLIEPRRNKTDLCEGGCHSDAIILNPPHPFLKLKITKPLDNRDIQSLLAEFRAFGGRYPKRKKLFKLSKNRDSYQRPQKANEDHIYKDALDVENHQRMPVLFCSFYFDPKSGSSFCATPTLLNMTFYGQQDIMLGQFLQRYCCKLSEMCQLCNLPKLGHVRRYVHSMGCVQVILSEDFMKNERNRMYFTAWCSICNDATPSVPLSETTKCLSFAKYLELRFHGHAYKKRNFEKTSPAQPQQQPNSSGLPETIAERKKCQHSLHRDYVHYFSYRGVGAQFQYAPIDVWEINLPPLVLQLQPPKSFDRFQVLEEVKNFSMRGHEVYTRINERIADLALEDESLPLVQNLKTAQSKDQFCFKQHIEIIQTLLTETKANAYDVSDALLMAKRILAEHINIWGPRLNDIAVAQKIAAKQNQQQNQQQPHQPPSIHGDSSEQHQIDAGLICTEDLQAENLNATSAEVGSTEDGVSQQEIGSVSEMDGVSTNLHGCVVEKKSSADNIFQNNSNLSGLSNNSDKKSIKKILINFLPSTSSINPLETPFSIHEHFTLPLGAFPILVHDHDMSSIIAYSLTSKDYQRAVINLSSQHASSIETVQQPSTPASAGITQSPGMKRKFLEGFPAESEDQQQSQSINTNNNNNNNNASEEERIKSKSNHSHVELSFQNNHTIFTCKIYFAQEFDNLRAKTLKPAKLDKSLYKDLEQSKKREELKISQSRSGPEMELVCKPSDGNITSNINNNDRYVSQTCGDASASSLNNNSNNSNNNSNNNTTSNNTAHKDEGILTANQQLQAEIEECRNALARSLRRSVQWEARGGKSGSKFSKTSDDRFVLKEMSKSEIGQFEHFAANYFEHVTKCHQQRQPTLLAKLFGVFKVTIKTKDFFLEKFILVMENLFYDRDIKNKFDLKGSERNRLVDPTTQQGETVLLDENLVQMSWSKPLYILSHSKAVLKDAINRDASFLEKNQVMDYSLLVGLDTNNELLVLGIIDYIRIFTLDKKIESIVKQTGILGGGMGKQPTIISPEPYKQRFTDAMDRYFHIVPDHWEGLSKT